MQKLYSKIFYPFQKNIIKTINHQKIQIIHIKNNSHQLIQNPLIFSQ